MQQDQQFSQVDLFRPKLAFVGHFFEELQTCFQLAWLLTRSLNILGTAGMNLACVRRALENVGNLKSVVQFF